MDLNIFKSLAQQSPQIAEELAEQARTHLKTSNVETSFVIRIMRLLTLYGYATETAPATYVANQHTMALGSPDGGVASWLIHNFDQSMGIMHKSVPYFAEHGYAFPTNDRVGPAQDYNKTDKTSYELWEDQPKVIANFQNFLRAMMHAVSPWFVWMNAAERIKQCRQEAKTEETSDVLLVDVGGGSGTNVRAFRDYLQNAGIKGRLIDEDLEHVIKEARVAEDAAVKEEPGSASSTVQIEYVPHDFLTPQPAVAQGALFYYVRYILHNCADDRSAALLARIAAAMNPGYSRLLINERVLRSMGNGLQASGLDLIMGIMHAARERTFEEYEELVTNAGMKVVAWHKCSDAGEDVVECMLA